jgi:hypothetical protein
MLAMRVNKYAHSSASSSEVWTTVLGFAADIDNVGRSRGTCNLVLHFICLDLFLHYSKRLCFRPLNPHLDLIEIKVSHANLKLLLCNATKLRIVIVSDLLVHSRNIPRCT